MHRSSDTIGAIASALAKAQAELNNPEKTLTATIPAPRGGERIFRYASLATGLELVRKSLGQHEIAIMQTTAVDQGQIMLTTLLVHASGEWISSLWPVCAVAEPSAQIKGAALTYARRYALFTLVGIAGEDDLDAPDLTSGADQPRPDQPTPGARKADGGRVHAPPPPDLTADQSAKVRERLVAEISSIETDEGLALWAHRALPVKNRLAEADAQAVEASYLAKLKACSDPPSTAREPTATQRQRVDDAARTSKGAPITKPVRRRSKVHLAFIASQPCLVCKASPCDAHHLKIARPRALGRKVSDEFTVPLCRVHHRELHRHGNEANWWANMQIAPVPIAKELWERRPVHGTPSNDLGPFRSGQPEQTEAHQP